MTETRLEILSSITEIIILGLFDPVTYRHPERLAKEDDSQQRFRGKAEAEDASSVNSHCSEKATDPMLAPLTSDLGNFLLLYGPIAYPHND